MAASVEILTLLDYLAIALIAVSIAVYAISVNYLGRATNRSLVWSRRRTTELKAKLRDLADTKENLDANSIKSEIGNFIREEKRLQSQVTWLKLRRAVIYPCLLFSMVFVLTCLDIYLLSNAFEAVLILSILGIGSGLFLLMKTLKVAELAAERIPLPAWRLVFRNESTIETCTGGKQTVLDFRLTNVGEIAGSDVKVAFFFPSKLKIITHKKKKKEKVEYEVIHQSPPARYAGYVAAVFDINRMSIEETIELGVRLLVPRTPKQFEIPVTVLERSSGGEERKLKLRVRES